MPWVVRIMLNNAEFTQPRTARAVVLVCVLGYIPITNQSDAGNGGTRGVDSSQQVPRFPQVLKRFDRVGFDLGDACDY
eukprot:3718740-Pyramimonas_sp.AAC.1